MFIVNGAISTHGLREKYNRERKVRHFCRKYQIINSDNSSENGRIPFKRACEAGEKARKKRLNEYSRMGGAKATEASLPLGF